MKKHTYIHTGEYLYNNHNSKVRTKLNFTRRGLSSVDNFVLLFNRCIKSQKNDDVHVTVQNILNNQVVHVLYTIILILSKTLFRKIIYAIVGDSTY